MSPVTEPTGCPSAYTLSGEQCYRLMSTEASWMSARRECQAQGGELATVNDPAEFQFLGGLLDDGHVWLGYTDKKWEGMYSSVDASVTYMLMLKDNWASGGGPEYGYGNDCIAMDTNPDKLIEMNCDDEHKYVCKMPLHQTPCPNGWSVHDNGDCTLLNSYFQTFYVAHVMCLLSGGDLLSPETMEEYKTIPSTARVWLGFNDGMTNVRDGNLQGSNGASTQLFSQLGVSPKVDNSSGVATCIVSNAGQWEEADCIQTLPFICKRNSGVNVGCPGDSISFGGKCYKTKFEQRVSFDDAQATCAGMGGNVMSINSYGEQTLLADMSSFGTYDVGSSFHVWLGMRENGVNGLYQPMDNSVMGFINWGPDQPNDMANNNCLAAEPMDYTWEDISCLNAYRFICEYTNTPCHFHSDCISTAECHMGQCKCRTGYSGDGATCHDVNECTSSPCDPQASCQNTDGSFVCTCAFPYAGDGLTCNNIDQCSSSLECHVNAECVGDVCSCKEGYTSDGQEGRLNCIDKDECATGEHRCSVNAECINNDGGYDCECLPNYEGDGFICGDNPANCQEIFEKDPSSRDGTYMIDADGGGPLSAFRVECKFADGVGVTIVDHDRNWRYKLGFPRKAQGSKKTLTYKNAQFEQARALVLNSGYCYQMAYFWTQGGTPMMANGNTVYVGGDGETHKSFSDLDGDYQCQCNVLGACENSGSTCNTDGTNMEEAYDAGRITRKDRLPVQEIRTGGTTSTMAGSYQISELKCGPRHFDIPRDCQDMKDNYFKRFRWNNVVALIDPDTSAGDAEGNLDPFFVYCDIRTYPHVGVTEVMHDMEEVDVNGVNIHSVNYRGATSPQLLKLLANAGFATQEIKYEGINTVISASTSMNTYWTSVTGLARSYWGGAAGTDNACACFLTNSCTGPDGRCNNGNPDNVPAVDGGVLMNKEDLPVGGVVIESPQAQGKITLGRLRCAAMQFGILPTCQDYFKLGYRDTYSTLFIDPDGVPEEPSDEEPNVDPFPVICQITENPPVARTLVGTNLEHLTTAESSMDVVYTSASMEQVTALVARSSHCSMNFEYNCMLSSLASSSWTSSNGTEHNYFIGNGGNGCNDGPCNCDAKDPLNTEDIGVLSNKDHFPVKTMTFNDLGVASVMLNKLACYEVYPTCFDHQKRYQKVNGLRWPKDGYYTIDADGAEGIHEFQAYCEFPYKTMIQVEAGNNPELDSEYLDDPSIFNGPDAKCIDIEYAGATQEQIEALISVSAACNQYGRFESRNVAMTGQNYWMDRTGNQQAGFAGNAGGSECACGEVDMCTGGQELACNTDNMDGDLHSDSGLFVDKTVLPVSQMCVQWPANVTERRSINYYFGDFVCAPKQVDVWHSCQELRNRGETVTGAYVIDSDGTRGLYDDEYDEKNLPFTAYCEMIEDPPVGITTITHKNPGCQDIPQSGADIDITYNAVSDDQLGDLIRRSRYCHQSMSYDCQDAPLQLGNGYGWYQRNGRLADFWAGNNEGTGCVGDDCECNTDDSMAHSDGGLLFTKWRLPVTRVNMADIPNNGTRCLTVDTLKCFEIYRDCDQIQRHRAKFNANGDHRYAIDPDQAGGEEFFGVKCDFWTNKEAPITTVITDGHTTPIPEGAPAAEETHIVYRGPATLKQIKGLIDTSQYCQQHLSYTCQNLPLINNNNPAYAYMIDYHGNEVYQWAGADNSNVTGCACAVLGTCPEGYTCRCDALPEGEYKEDGYLTNHDLLPLQGIYVGGASDTGSGTYDFGGLQCAQQPFSLPKDCNEARRSKKTSGEVLIQPAANVKPFLVYCDYDTFPDAVVGRPPVSVTVVPTAITQDSRIDGTLNVEYAQGDLDAIAALVQISAHCYMPAKINCQYTMTNGTYFTSADGVQHYYVGHGSHSGECSCGADDKCGGHDGRDKMAARDCNCFIGDEEIRGDGGVIANKDDLPLASIFVPLGDNALASASMTFGSLYCSPRDIDIDECSLGFDDCDPNADCINLPGGFDCECRHGYRGVGVPAAYTNGRQCVDDNECISNPCTDFAHCINIPGSYLCECFPGYKMNTVTGECEDVDECEDLIDGCDENAMCFNTQGSYYCECGEGFSGSGMAGQCNEQGVCHSWGDPHYTSFDGKFSRDFRSSCEHVMARDGCSGGVPVDDETFSVIVKNAMLDPENTEAWNREVTLKIFGYVIAIKEGKTVFVNGRRIPNLPMFLLHGVRITRYGKALLINTAQGIDVYWSGFARIKVTVMPRYKGQMCGLCGDYDGNPDNDWTIGPSTCEHGTPGTVASSLQLFGESWFYGNEANDTRCEHCSQDDDITDPQCTGDAMQEAMFECHLLLSVSGRFADCLPYLRPELVDILHQACSSDLCNTNDPAIMCSTAEAIADRCEEQVPRITLNWRADGFCALTCGEGMVYTTCGSPCQPSCNDDGSVAACEDTCVEGCVCEDGLVRDGDRCIAPEQCGCMKDGVYFKLGDSVVSEDCSTECTCTEAASEMTCLSLTCDPKSSCHMDGGVVDCYCSYGAEGDGRQCGDYDECAHDHDNCAVHADCKNTDGSYTCTCHQGYQGDGVTCDDVDECAQGSHTCGPRETCKNKAGGFTCLCREGTRRNEVTNDCDNVDECAAGNDDCDRASTSCSDEDGGYACPCKTGYKYYDEYTCIDINECEGANNCSSNAACHNSLGSYSCSCNEGYHGDGITCNDIDECSAEHHDNCHHNADCTNVPGTYRCTCKPGYEGDGNSCTPVSPPECTLYCSNNQECEVNVADGRTECRCVQGTDAYFDHAGNLVCGERNECLDGSHQCDHNAECVNKQIGYSCACRDGYKGSGYTCSDIDECASGDNECDANADCENTRGSYTCTCHQGYEGDGKSCRDVDECSRGNNKCGPNTECKDTAGGYKCKCLRGFMGHCDECQDIDECHTGKSNCHPTLATCANTFGSYECTCQDGFSGNGRVCSDVNECALGLDNCQDGKTDCVNTKGGYQCLCRAGYKKNSNDECIDINECSSSENQCHRNAHCTNTEGSYSCQCKDGYQGEGFQCEPENPSLCGGVRCDPAASCVSMDDGTKACMCHDGFEGPGYVKDGSPGCNEIDPCLNNYCDCHATCEAIAAKAVCTCDSGYTGNGYFCTKVNPCTDSDICAENAECTVDPADSLSHLCVCQPGYMAMDNFDCEDDDECMSGNTTCPDNAVCVNTPGSYTCECEEGYEAEVNEEGNTVCTDINECAMNMDDCDDMPRGICVNSEGSYTCQCKQGYTSLSNNGRKCIKNDDNGCTADCPDVKQYCKKVGSYVQYCACIDGTDREIENNVRTCVDISECSADPCDPNASCTDSIPGFHCECNEGYVGNGIICDDIDECELAEDECHEHADCVNEDGSYSCECTTGYRGDGVVNCDEIPSDEDICGCGQNGICESTTLRCDCKPGYSADYNIHNNKCIDMDDCNMEGHCHPAAVCEDLEGGYSCQCPAGMVGDGLLTCDVDECALGTSNCDIHADCINHIGYYDCECRKGYLGDGFDCYPLSDACMNNQCGDNALCSSVNGQAQCECEAGYEGDGEKCVDVNECECLGNDKHDCDPNAYCSNYEGGYYCECQPGYRGNGRDCMDMDECFEGSSLCSPLANCTNTDGGYTCECMPGFTGDGYICTAGSGNGDDPCGSCHDNAVCRSTETGGFMCQCMYGYEDTGTTCTNVNECALGSHLCDENAVCFDTDGAYGCGCKSGYKGDGHYCVDVNECLRDSMHTCPMDAHCVNMDGGYDCVCPDGYQVNNGVCQDIDECESSDNSCDDNADCVNIPGTYGCHCGAGYYGNGITCQVCHGGDCACSDGYMYDGASMSCINIDECMIPTYSGYRELCVNADCVDDNPGYRCECKPGYEPDPVDEHVCVDINECDIIADLCGFYGECYNVKGSYECACANGYISDGDNNCVELETTKLIYGGDSSVRGDGGGRGCEVRADATYTIPEHKACKNCWHSKDIDECAEADICGDMEAAMCSNSGGSFECVCRTGYSKQGEHCQDNDECVLTPGICGEEALCINMPGTYRCDCPLGYRQNGGKCINIDECQDRPCDPNAECMDTEGSYMCQCNTGFAGDGKVCSAICAPGVCPPRQVCAVRNGRPYCTCGCPDPECNSGGMVCGSDGLTYASDADRILKSCLIGKDITRAYRGKCQDSCSSVSCSEYRECVVTSKGLPTCECQTLEPADWTSGPVCLTNGETYPSIGMLKLLGCAKNMMAKIQSYGKCKRTRDCAYHDWSSWTGCSATCGEGVKQRLREVKYQPEFGGKDCDQTEQVRSCQVQACEGDPCYDHMCERSGSYCVVHGDNPRCRCQSCGGEKTNYVCGLQGTSMISAVNLCRLQRAACMANTTYEIIHPGKCNDGEPNEPLQCTMMPHYTKVYDDAGCVSKETVEINTCSGGCGKITGQCCEPDKFDYVYQQFVCPDGGLKISQVLVTKSCHCINGADKIHRDPVKYLY